MSTLVFVVPENGDEVAPPDMRWLRGLVLHGGADVWCGGSGQGWLRHPGGAELLLSFAAGHGFFPEYVGPRGERWLALTDGRGEGKVPVWIGGDPIIVCERFFVAPELAWAAVEEFCVSGEPTPRIRWGRQSEVGWLFGYWDHPEVPFR